MSNKYDPANVHIREIQQTDFFWLKDFDCTPLARERDSIYLLFSVHHRRTSFVAIDVATRSPVGFLLGMLPAASDSAYMHYLFVHELHRRRGIGSALVTAFAGATRTLGAQRITIFTKRAEAFYEHLGFERRSEVFIDSIAEYIRGTKQAEIMTQEFT